MVAAKFPLQIESTSMAPLTLQQRLNIIGRLQAGQSQSVVARHFDVAPSTISRLWRRFQQTDSVADRPRSGRPRATTPAEDRLIRLRHLRNRFENASFTAQTMPQGRRISDQTVRNRLHDAGLWARRPYRGPVLTARHRHTRLQWANQHRRWTVGNDWRRVWFSDESFFVLQRHDRRRRVYRRVHERYAQNVVDEAPAHGGGGVLVWGAINFMGRSNLVHIEGRLNAERYVDEILRPHVLPLVAANGSIFQQDNARPHVAQLTARFLAQHNVETIPWPAMSPDMNPIEHLWDELDRRIRSRNVAPTNVRQLFVALQEEWETIPQQHIQRLVSSMSRRCRSMIVARGGHTPY